MPISTILILAVIIAAFTLFAVVLAWGDYQTRNVSRERRQSVGSKSQVQSLRRAVEVAEGTVIRPAAEKAQNATAKV